MIQLPPDFKELLNLLNSNNVKYLVVGGYAVAFHGYPRTTGDIDIWTSNDSDNVRKLMVALKEFGFDVPEYEKTRFLTEKRILRMGFPPLRVELMNSISGVEFQSCFESKHMVVLEDIEVSFINLDDLKTYKKASGRHQDLNDLEKLP
ncbi:MAG: hypothetical protein A2161_05480 [Candidatus Schekmanbacteria bacterium RBG_13_48_7]|uniref:DUF6036 domain-containing protein n=1 Tax=Candidatus Schekmanbacteria bacterium RBG_13_48_7 TaxID=1817878 RepID=A0A1F7S4H9_9BACT|nr:MAG: hypothetical protein A2161_05480 [Candidatus Schekmanbacteria bacterium RBG_13_48_7]